MSNVTDKETVAVIIVLIKINHKNDMKKLILLMVLFLCGASLFAQHDTYIQEYLERLVNSKKYLLVVAEAMPEDKYDYRVTPESMGFEEHLMHIAWAMDWHSQSLMGGRKRSDWNTETHRL